MSSRKDVVVADSARRRICLVTTEFHGMFRNGGIGTANTSLALHLAEAGLDVTVAFANADERGPRTQMGDFTALVAQYRLRGITLDYVRPPAFLPRAFDDPRSASYAVLAFIQAGRFDVVLFNENTGHGFYTILAKQAGLFESPPHIVVVTHGPTDWVLTLNAQPYWGREAVVMSYMERSCVALADTLVSPSRYLLDWMAQQGWPIAARHRVVQNMVDVRDRLRPQARPKGRQDIREIVFFGRQERRKGLAVFCDAIDALSRTEDFSGVMVTFLGKFGRISELHSGVYLAERTRDWPVTPRFITVYDQSEALRYLARPGVLAVIPSLAENSPCVVAECLQLGLPFLASDSGGTAELIHPDDRAACLFTPTAAALATRLRDVMQAGHAPGRLAVAQSDVLAQWLDLLAPAADPERVVRSNLPLVSVCLVHADDEPWPAACLQSVLDQDYKSLEVVIACDKAPTDGPTQRRVRSVLGAAPSRDLAAREAKGKFLLFIDAGTVLLPDCVATLVTAATASDADILTGFPAPGDGVLPIGACTELGAFENCFGEGVVLVRATTYRKGSGYDPAAGFAADWLFLATAVLAQHTLAVVPAPLFTRTVARPPVAGELVAASRRVVHAYRDSPVSLFSRMMELVMGLHRQVSADLPGRLVHLPGPAREIALRLTDLEPESPEASRAFVEYCCERRLTSLALDFTLLNDISLLPTTITAARPQIGALTHDIAQRRRFALWHEADLTEEVRTRARFIAKLPEAADLVRSGEAALSHPVTAGLCLVRVEAVCPPGTSRVAVRVAATRNGAGPVRAAVAVCRPGARLTVSDVVTVEDGAVAWSGWLEPGDSAGVPTQLVASIAEPTCDVLDLYLLSRYGEAPSGAPETMLWQGVVAEITVDGENASRATAAEQRIQAIPAEVIHQGIVLTDTSAFPFPVFIPGRRTMLHPILGRAVVVRLAGAVPPGMRGLRAVVAAGHPEAHPIDFAFWLRPAQEAALDEQDLAETEGFSGWLSVTQPLVQHYLSVILPRAVGSRMDIYLATRAVQSQDVNFCHAFWDELWTIE